LVTGATGNVGSAVVRALADRGLPVRAFVRDRVKAAERLGSEVAVAVGDFEDPPSISAALQGCDRVFVTSSNGDREVDHECAVIDAAAAAGVALVVKLSTIGAEAGSPVPGLDWHGRIEAHLRGSRVPAAIVRSNFMMSNMLASAPQIASGQLPAPAGGGLVSMIDPRDAGAAAAAVLSSDGHEGRTYQVTGGEAIGFADVATVLSSVLGTPITYVDVPAEAARAAFGGAGLPPWLVAQLDGVFALVRTGALAPVTDTFTALTGSRTRSFADWANDNAPLLKP
jgi:uncharacterized protein YbjT (DUF2867 family)